MQPPHWATLKKKETPLLPQKVWNMTKPYNFHKKDVPFWVHLEAGARKCSQTMLNHCRRVILIKTVETTEKANKKGTSLVDNHLHKHIGYLQRDYRRFSKEQESFVIVNTDTTCTAATWPMQTTIHLSTLSLSPTNYWTEMKRLNHKILPAT